MQLAATVLRLGLLGRLVAGDGFEGLSMLQTGTEADSEDGAPFTPPEGLMAASVPMFHRINEKVALAKQQLEHKCHDAATVAECDVSKQLLDRFSEEVEEKQYEVRSPRSSRSSRHRVRGKALEFDESEQSLEALEQTTEQRFAPAEEDGPEPRALFKARSGADAAAGTEVSLMDVVFRDWLDGHKPFDDWDADHNGRISRHEAAVSMRKLGKVSDKKIESFFALMDTDHSGAISREDAYTFLRSSVFARHSVPDFDYYHPEMTTAMGLQKAETAVWPSRVMNAASKIIIVLAIPLAMMLIHCFAFTGSSKPETSRAAKERTDTAGLRIFGGSQFVTAAPQ